MIHKIQRLISRPHTPCILLLSRPNLDFQVILPSQVDRMPQHDPLRNNQRAQRERIPKHIRRRPVYLPGHNPRQIANRLLDADLQRAAVMRRHIHIQPGDVQSDAGIRRDPDEIRREVLDRIIRDGQEQNVPHQPENIRDQQEQRKATIAIRRPGDAHKDNRRPEVHRHREDVAHQRIIADPLEDGGQERAEPVQQDILAELRDGAEGELGVGDGDAHLGPAELAAAHVGGALGVAHPHHVFLVGGEEVGVGRVVGEPEPDQDGADEAEEAFDDVHPSDSYISCRPDNPKGSERSEVPPTSLPPNPIHVQQSIREQAAERAGNRGAAHQIRDALGLLLAAVDHRQVQVQAGEEAGLAGPENEAGRVQRGDIRHEPGEDGRDRPDDAQAG